MLRAYCILLSVMLLSLITSCKPSVPDEYISPDDMEDILYDYHVAIAMANEDNGSSSERDFKEQLYINTVLNKYGVSRAQFDSSMVYYFQHAKTLQEIYASVSKRLEKEALNLGASESEIGKYAHYSTTGDTANIWQGPTSEMLSVYAPYNHIQFDISADSTYKEGDALQLNFNVDFLFQEGSREGQVYLAVRYDNDTLVSRQIMISSAGVNMLSIPALDGHSIKHISGFFYLGNSFGSNSKTLKLMFVNQIQLVRFHRAPEPAAPASDSLSVTSDSLAPTKP